MGIDLYLLPVDGDHLPTLFYAHVVINLHRNAILGDIREVADKHGVDIPTPLSCYLARHESGEHGYGDASNDPYGDPLQYVLAKHLKPLAKKLGIEFDEEPMVRPTAWDHVQEVPQKKGRLTKVKKTEVRDGYESWLNRAAFAYVCALPDDFKIVLYWH